jgi:hypothetical protein
MDTSVHPLISTTSELQQVRDLAQFSQPGEIHLIAGQQRSVWPATQVIADFLVLLGPLRIILGGNRYTLQYLPLMLSNRVVDIYSVIESIHVSRAETCYQMLDALQKTPSIKEPLLMMEMLDPFYDENLSNSEVKGLLARCIAILHRVSKIAPVFISADPDKERPELIKMLFAAATQTLRLHPNIKVEPASQLMLL